MEIYISLIALITSILSLILSFLQSLNKKIVAHDIKIKNLNDGLDLLFDGNDKINIELVNYNDRDILLYLKDGYVEINNQEYSIKPEYYTAKSNSVTNIQIEIHPLLRQRFDKRKGLYLLFQYKGLLFNRNYKVRRKLR